MTCALALVAAAALGAAIGARLARRHTPAPIVAPDALAGHWEGVARRGRTTAGVRR